jgi:nucleoside phosphorylase
MMSGRHGRAVILTALAPEYDAVRLHITNLHPYVHRSGTRYELGRLSDAGSGWEVVLAEIGEGNQVAATLTGQAIDTFDPDLVMFVGVAGSLVDSVQLGDVVAATKVDAYHGGKQVGTRFMARPATWPAAWRLDQAARQVRRERRWLTRLGEPPAQLAEVLAARPPEVHLKPILAGEVVVDSRETRLYRFLREHYNDAVAVEMEGAGLATAAHASGAVPSMVVRGISDLAGGGKAASDAAGWQEQAAAHAAAFAAQLLVTLDPKAFPRAPREEEESSRPVVHAHPKKDRSTRPYWDPSTGRCEGEGSPVIPRQWQVSAPRNLDAGRVVRPGQVVTLGLRNKFGQQHEMYWISATVFAPDGTSIQTERTLTGDEWAEVIYPTDFVGAPASYPPGSYTVLWEVSEGFLACDGFLVEDRTTFGAPTTQADPQLQEFERAWKNLRTVMQQAQSNPEAARSELVQVIDQVIIARTYSRQTLAEIYGDWVGDQYLFEVDDRVGAPTRELNDLVEGWTLGGGDLPTQDILARLQRLLATPDSTEP